MNENNQDELSRLFRVSEENLLAMELFSALLNERAAFFSKEEVDAFAKDCGLSAADAFRALLCAACGLESDINPLHRKMEEKYFFPAVQPLDVRKYREDPFYRTVRMPEKALGDWQLTNQTYQPYEVFCYNDPVVHEDGREIPPIGYFTESFSFPAVLEKGRLWMAITPNEVETMQQDIAAAHGKIAVFGLGLGYYAFMTARMDRVSSVTIIERDHNVISLFQKYLLPQFPHAEKIRVVEADAFDFLKKAMPKEQYDFAYVDIWHDVLDGTPLYLKARQMEKYSPNTEFTYWIEKSMLIWLRGVMIEEIKEGKGTLLNLLAKNKQPEESLLPLLTLENIKRLTLSIPPDAVLPS